jgi:cobalt-zinc-cadmium efflux system outer membrane protein
MPFVPSWATALVVVQLSAPPAEDRCRKGPLDRATVIACATRDNPRLEAHEAAMKVAAARRTTARVVLPSHPELEVLGATRKAPGIPRNWNLYGTLRQELEVGGQRRRRMDVAASEHDVASARARTTRRDIVADALLAYYDVLAARERRVLVEQARRVSGALASLAAARSKAGSEAGLTADLAEIAAVALERGALEHARAEAIADATLARALGLSPDELPQVSGSLAPIEFPERSAEPSARAELAEARAIERLRVRETALVRRQLVPNPSVSLFVQRDGFAELVVGAGVALPLPLPGPVGPLTKSRVAESRAREREAGLQSAAVVRAIELDVDVTREDLRTRRAMATLYTEDLLTRARADLDALAKALADGQMDVRGALLAQQQLLEFIEGDIDARHEACRAAIAAARARGIDWKNVP